MATTNVSRVCFNARRVLIEDISTRVGDAVGTMKALGMQEGEVKLAIKQTTHEIKDDCAGDDIQGIINKSTDVNVKVSAKEFDKDQLTLCLKDSLFSEITPDGVGATKVLGIGTETNGKNLSSVTRRVVLECVDAQDKTFDICLPKAIVILDGELAFSGNKETTLGLSIQAMRDDTLKLGCNKMILGDYTQTLTK